MGLADLIWNTMNKHFKQSLNPVFFFAGTNVINVAATDADSSQNAQVTFSLTGKVFMQSEYNSLKNIYQIMQSSLSC